MPPPWSEYHDEIEQLFRLRGSVNTFLRPENLDYQLVMDWYNAGIPLAVVIEAINAVFDKNESSARRKTISSLLYCKHAVKDLWSERKELFIGGRDETPESDADAMLEALAADVETASAPAEILAEVAQRVRGLVREKSVPAIEESLMELERELIELVVGSLPADDRAELQTDIARSLGDTSKLNDKTRARTEEANLRRIVRDRFALPRLTLFR